jgi:AcrR family transcriptional regulator
MPSDRRRLPPGERRSELVRVAAGEFAGKAYHDVLMTQVADLAGVSRALLYRYFPTKRDLFAAVYGDAASRLIAASPLKPGQDLVEQVLTGLDAHLDFFEANARTVLVANRGELAGDPVIQAIITEELAELRHAMLDAMGTEGRARARASTALYGWLSFVQSVCVDWLAGGVLTRREVRDMCLRTLTASLDLDDTSPQSHPKSGTETSARELGGRGGASEG